MRSLNNSYAYVVCLPTDPSTGGSIKILIVGELQSFYFFACKTIISFFRPVFTMLSGILFSTFVQLGIMILTSRTGRSAVCLTVQPALLSSDD